MERCGPHVAISPAILRFSNLQRFGTSKVGTHIIGRSLLRGEWEGAVKLVLEPRAEVISKRNADRRSSVCPWTRCSTHCAPHRQSALLRLTSSHHFSR